MDDKLANERELSMIIRKIRTYMEDPTPLRTCLTIRNVATVLHQAIPALRSDVSIVTCAMDTIIHVVSPLKGSYPALMDVFSIGGPIPYFTYVFLGDIVGTGPNSIEVLCLILAYKVLYPNRVYVLIGESEIDFLDYYSGKLAQNTLTPELMEEEILTRPDSFASEIFRKYGSKLQERNNDTTALELLRNALGSLPAAARAGAYFCATGIPRVELLNAPDLIRVRNLLNSPSEDGKQKKKKLTSKELLGIPENAEPEEKKEKKRLSMCLAKQNGRAAIISHWCETNKTHSARQDDKVTQSNSSTPDGIRADKIAKGIAAQDEPPRFHYANDFQQTEQRVVPMFHIDTMHNIQRTLYLQNAEPTTNETREQLLGISESLVF